ncbi:MAG: FliH/SctL family protein [Legionellales bacterium]
MDFERWNYPHVDTLMSLHHTDAAEATLEQNAPEPTPELSIQEQEQAAHTQELTAHLQTLRTINQSVSTQISAVNETFLINMTSLIKKVTESVILKEIALDKDRLQHMMEHALRQIQHENEPCTIHLSSEQHAYFSAQASMPAEVVIKPDPTLNQGDFRIKTTHSELESILEHRLNELFEL